MGKSAQDRFSKLVAERDTLKKEINQWIYKAQKMERQRDAIHGFMTHIFNKLEVFLKSTIKMS